jgi:hypothetical protein
MQWQLCYMLHCAAVMTLMALMPTAATSAVAAVAAFRLYVKCEVGALLSAQQASTLAAQLAEAQAAVERLTGQWQTAEAAKQELIRAAGRRAEQAAAHAVERMHAQVRRGWKGFLRVLAIAAFHDCTVPKTWP